MVIVHVAPNAPYNENWGYQENLLPKYQKAMGHEVILIISCKKHENGKKIEVDEEDKVLYDGVRIIRRKQCNFISPLINNITSYIKIYDLLMELQPDFIFFHGLVSYSIMDAVRYKKKVKSCTIVQDNHMDYNIGFSSYTLKKKILRSWYRYIVKRSIGYVDKVYGVTPWRKTYAEDYFHVPIDKLDVLIMGADDEKIHFDKKMDIRTDIRKQYEITDDTFLIVTGGKIDKNKKIDLLAEACMNMPGVKLIIFGQIANDCKDYFDNLFSKTQNILFIGWVEGDKVYNWFFAADLVFFPGQHSVLWEQACASKVPCVFAKWEGMDHVDVGGNCDFVDPVNIDTIKEKIAELMFTKKYIEMKRIAQSKATDVFLYSQIANKSLECANTEK